MENVRAQALRHKVNLETSTLDDILVYILEYYTDIYNSRSISREDLDFLKLKIAALRGYIKDKLRIMLKFHYLMHYPAMMARFGPLRDLWCMRHEAKRQYAASIL